MAAVVIGIALKGVFEFWQEWLVGSVVTRTLFDVRNQFFRAVVHQDFRQHAEAGSGSEIGRAGPYLRQQCFRHLEVTAQVVVPADIVQVEQQRT